MRQAKGRSMEIVADRIDPSTPRDLAMFTAMPFRRFLGLNQAKLIIDDATTCGIDEIIRWALPAGLRIRADRPITTPFADPALRMVGIDHRLYRRIGDHDLLLVEPTSGAIVGVHVYHTLAIAPAFRGLGLGPELLIEHILRGGSHVSVDIFGNVLFNHAGVENRRRAHALLRDTAWRERKQQTLA